MKNKNNKLVILLTIIIICLVVCGGFVLYKVLSDTPNSNMGGSENNNQQLSGDNSNGLKNYNLNNVKDVIVSVPVKNAQDPEMKNVTLTNKDEIKALLIQLDNAKKIGNIPEIGCINCVNITVNYNGDPSTKIIILKNGNVAINYGVGAGETGYGEYSIENKNLAVELTNRYND